MDVVSLFKRARFDLSSEQNLKDEIESIYKLYAIEYKREFRLDKLSILDFYMPHDKVAIEVKIKGRAKDIYQQCERYCQYQEVNSLILLTNKIMGLPKEINGKPVQVVSLGVGWL